jgi:hypothetical protein
VRFSEHYLSNRFAIRGITLEQAVWAVNNAVTFFNQDDGRTRYWGFVPQLDRHLRVVVDLDGETIITTFIDSRFSP